MNSYPLRLPCLFLLAGGQALSGCSSSSSVDAPAQSNGEASDSTSVESSSEDATSAQTLSGSTSLGTSTEDVWTNADAGTVPMDGGSSDGETSAPDGDTGVRDGGASGDAGTPQEDCTSLTRALEAEVAVLRGVSAAADVGGFEGEGYVENFDAVDDEVSFEVCIPESGYYTVSFRYTAGPDAAPTRTLLVDERPFPAPAPMRFAPLWTNVWQTDPQRALHLESGKHQFTLRYTAADRGELLLDGLQLDHGPSPTDVSVRSLLMNDWEDLVVGWQASRLYPSDDAGFGPRMVGLHTDVDWPTNQLDEAQAFFRDDTANVAYDDPNQFEASARFGTTDGTYGELRVSYDTYDGRALPVAITRRQVVSPGEDAIVVIYELENSNDQARQFSVLEWADLHNKTAGASEDPADTGEVTSPTGTLSAEWDTEANVWLVDMTSTNGTALAFGSFQEPSRRVAGTPVSAGPDREAALPMAFWEDPTALENTNAFEGEDVGVGLSATISLAERETKRVAFFYTIAASVSEAKSQALGIRSSGDDASSIAARSARAWRDWLDEGAAGSLELAVPAWQELLTATMLTIRQAQQPEFGSFVAATNPAYFYSVWPRDAAVTAIALDAAGYLTEGAKYWRWMANAQADGSNPDFPSGTWWTNYGYWSPARGIPFVSPEWDSLGLFLVGVYHHHRALASNADAAEQFLADVWPAIQNAANFIHAGANDPSNNGFGPEDFSIWEEDLAFHAFTQATYVAGLRAAASLSREMDDEHAEWDTAAASILEAINRPVSAEPCPGLWDDVNQYFVRSIRTDCTPNRILDGASDMLWVLGAVTEDEPRMAAHRDAILFNLTPSEWGHGISRYEGDTFYFSSEFNPGGSYEALEAMPTWPQMAMYMAMMEHWMGMDEAATQRLSWQAATSLFGSIPQGEAVDWSLQAPLVSTAAEPVTGGWFTLGLLTYLDRFDMRVPASPNE